nr:ubiquitin carboxyl terminal hydrolase 24 [Hymenolepis microstoma]
MSENVDDYTSNIQKLQLMGFGNDSEIKEALVSCENDIDCAITFLVNRNFEATVETHENTIIEKQEITSVEIKDFPVDELKKLEDSLYVKKWNIPCLRSQSLGLCLSSAIHIVNTGDLSAFESTEPLQRFMSKCLPECLNKFLTSNAVLQWDAETLEGVHNMLELAVQLSVECLIVGKRNISHSEQTTLHASLQNLITLAFSYLELIFNPECNYHQRCRDRTTNTGTYVDHFSTWGSNKEDTTEKQAIAETLPAPKNFYLVNLLNCFGVHNGMELVLWYGTRSYLPLKMMQSMMGPLADVSEYLTPRTICRYVGWLMIRTFWLIHNLTYEDFNPQESRIFDLITSLRVLCYRFANLSADATNQESGLPFNVADFSQPRQPEWDILMAQNPVVAPTIALSVAKVDERHLALLLSSLCPPAGASSSFKVRMLAIRHLIDQVTAVQHAKLAKSAVTAGSGAMVTSTSILAAENQAFLRRRKLHRLIRHDTLMHWVREKAVVQSIMTNLDNVTYVATLCELFRCLVDHITMEDITILWKCQETQSNAGVNNILKLLSEVSANGFNQAQFEHVQQLVRESWCALDIQARIQFTRSAGDGKIGMKHRYRHRLSINAITTPHTRHPVVESSEIRNARHRLLNFVATIAIASREAWVSDLCLRLLWQLSHGLHPKSPERRKSASNDIEEKGKGGFGKFERFVSVLSSGGSGTSNVGRVGGSAVGVDGGSMNHYPLNPEHTEAAINQLVIVLRECRLPANEQRQRLNTWLSIAAEELKRGKSAYYVLDFLQTILDLICKPLPGRSKKDALRELNKTHSLIDTVCNSLHRVQKHTATAKHVTTSSPSKSSSYENGNSVQHCDVINRHLTVLHYILSTADIHLSTDRTQGIWDTLVNDFGGAHFDVEKTLIWFSSAIDLIESDAQNNLFTKNIIKLPPTSIQTYTGFQCFESFFVKVNLNEGRLKTSQDGWTVERMDLIGVDFLWDLYVSLPPPTNSLDSHESTTSTTPAIGKVNSHVSAKVNAEVLTETLSEAQVFNRRQAIHKARKLLLLISWSQLSAKLKRDPESCHKRFFDYCRKRIEINLAASPSYTTHSERVQLESQQLVTMHRPTQPSLRSLLADTGQFLASLLVGPKAAASARCRLSKTSRLALYRLLYIVFSYIENAEDELIGAHEPPSCWKPHYMSFRGWEIRIPLRVFSPSGQLLISSTLPLTARCHVTSFNLCFSDATAHFLQNPVLVVHSNATLASVRKLVALIIPVCLYAISNTTTQFAIGSEVLSLDSIKPPGVSGLHELTKRNRQAPLSDPKSETPLGHKLDREAIGELGFQTGRTLLIRLHLHSDSHSITNGSNSNISEGFLRRSSGLSMKLSTSGKFHISGLSSQTPSISSISKKTSFMHTDRQNIPNSTGSGNPGDLNALVTPFTLPSLMLSANGSVYESLFGIAENDLAETGSAPNGPNLLHMTRLLLYCLPTYHQQDGIHGSERSGKGSLKSASGAFASSMICTPQTLVKAPQFRLLYLLQILSGQLVPRESSAWWECAPNTDLSISSKILLSSEVPRSEIPYYSPNHTTPPEIEDNTSSQTESRGESTTTTSTPTVRPATSAMALISSEICLNVPSKSSMVEPVANASTSCPPSPEMNRKPKKHKTRWFIGGDNSSRSKSKEISSEDSATLNKVYVKNDWLESLVVILRKQLIEDTVKTEERGPLLIPGMFARMVVPKAAPPTPAAMISDASRSDAWISREIKHCALQILATLLNPSTFGSVDGTGSYSRSSSFSSSYSSISTLMQPEFAPKLISVLMDTALASATNACDGQPGDCLSHSVEGGTNSLNTKRKQKRQGLLPINESHAGVANALDPLTSSTSYALTCQDVEIAVQSTRLLCQCVYSYSSLFMCPFVEMPDLRGSIIRLLVSSPSLRVRTETCQQLKQLLFLFAGHQHQSIITSFGVEPCCQLFAWETSHSASPPPYGFEQFSLQMARKNPYIDILLDVLFRIPRESGMMKHSSSSKDKVLPSFWTTNKLSTLIDNEEKNTMLHCSEFFRLRGRIFGLIDEECLVEYAGQNHVSIFESEIQWFKDFAHTDSQAHFWGDVTLPMLDCALLNGHLCFLRMACIQLIAMVAGRSASQSRSGGAGCIAGGHSAGLSTTAVLEAVGGGSGARHVTGCRGLAPPPFLLTGKRKDKNKEDSGLPLILRSAQNIICQPSAVSISDSKLTEMVTNCVHLMRDLVPILITNYMFPVANTMLEEYYTSPTSNTEGNPIRGNTLLQPPSKRLNGNARQEAFMLLLFLARMDFQCLESTVNLLVRLHHQNLPEESRPSHSLASSMNLSTGANLRDSGGLTFDTDMNTGASNSIMWDYKPSLRGRAACNFTGLRNGGGTCYMNVVLQQLFMQPGVAEAILDVPTSKLDENSLLYQTQELFLNLLFSQLQYYDPVGFWNVFKLWNTDTPIDPHEQQDAFDFFQSLIDQLDEGIKKFNDVPFFSRMFHGLLSDTMYCEDCGHRYNREQSFSAINLTVCTGDLLEEMRQYTREEVLDGDNAYFCERCQMKQRTLKRLTFNSLPPVLCLQLKRFGFDWERQVAVKSNQAFSFPRRLDMTPFMGDNAVVIPSGVSMQSNISTDTAKKNSTDASTESGKMGFHLYDPDEEDEQEESKEPQLISTLTSIPTELVPPRVGSGEKNVHPSLLKHPSSRSESIDVQSPSFVYELIGIVIHSGQAHAGHYYSFIRDRGRMEPYKGSDRERSQSITAMLGLHNSQNPIRNFVRTDTLTQGADDVSASNDASQPERWLKFNDTYIEEVDMTDEFLQQECFGGTYLAETPGRPPEKRTRNYSAYLLFYQRVPSTTSTQSTYNNSQSGENQRSRHPSGASTKKRSSLNALGFRRNRHSSLSVEKSLFSTLDEGRFQKPRFSVDLVHSPVSRGSHRAVQFSRTLHSNSANATSAMRQPRLSLGLTSNHLRASPIPGGRPSSTCLFALSGSNSGLDGRMDSWTGEVPVDSTVESTLLTAGSGANANNASSSADEMLHRIRKQNLAFLRDQSILSPDYVSFTYNLAQGVLVDTGAMQLEPERAIVGCQMVANFLFATYLALHASVKVSISPELCKRLLGLCAPAPQNGGENSNHHHTSASEQASLQEAGTKLDTHWMETLLALMTANAHAVSWSLGFLVRSPTKPILNYMLACPKPQLRHQSARLVGVVLSTFYASKDASILDAALNNLVDYLLDLLAVEVPTYAHHCGSYFGLLRGYVETCPHASVHLSNRSGTRRLLCFLVAEDSEHEETLSIDTGALSPTRPTPTSTSIGTETGSLSIAVPSIVSPQKDAGFPTWASTLRNWTASQSKELGNFYLLLAHMLLQSNFDQFRNCPLVPSTLHPSRLRLFPRPETARWLGFSSLATSSDALCPASARGLPPRLRYVGMFLLVEAVIRCYVENPHTPPPPQRQHDHHHQQQPQQQQQQPFQSQQSGYGAPSAGKVDSTPSSTEVVSVTSTSEEYALRETMVDVLAHLTQSWWIPSAAFISVVCSICYWVGWCVCDLKTL